ncbi:MAG: phosphatase, partial [Thermoproteota archaeon]
MTIQKLDDGIFVDTAQIDKIKSIDAVIFDCDGVLIDISNSYDLAIKKTVDFILQEMQGIDLPKIVSTKMIDGFKATGGFNDEVDVTYSIILSVVAAKKLNRNVSEFI